MIRSRFALLGLCAAVFGVMAFGASAAQATEGAHWGILNSTGTVKTDAGSLPAIIELEAETTAPPILHSKIAGIAVLFECTTATTVNAKLIGNGSIGESVGNVKGSKIKFSGCITKLNGATSAPCKPNAGGTQSGVIITQPGHGLAVLHTLEGGTKDELTQILPDTGETFAFIETSEECAIGAKVAVIGKAFLKDCKNEFLKHLVKHLVEIGPLTELWTISKTAEHVATILGSSFAFLGGAHVGLAWGGEV